MTRERLTYHPCDCPKCGAYLGWRTPKYIDDDNMHIDCSCGWLCSFPPVDKRRAAMRGPV